MNVCATMTDDPVNDYARVLVDYCLKVQPGWLVRPHGRERGHVDVGYFGPREARSSSAA